MEDCERYYYIDRFGQIESTTFWSSTETDRVAFELGNCFKTREEAETALLKRKAETKLLKLCDGLHLHEGFAPNIREDGSINVLVSSCSPYRFATKESAQNAIRKHMTMYEMSLVLNQELED